MARPAKDDPRARRRRAGLERLKALGLGPESPAGDLERAAAGHPDAALAVAAMLGESGGAAGVEALRRLEAGGGDKEIRREARRALYRLRQRGVAVPEEPAPAAVTRPPIFGAVEPEGFLSPPDPHGDRLVWIAKPRTGGGLLHLSTIVNEPGGLKEAVLGDVTRKGLRQLRGELAKRHGVRLVEAPWRYCDWIASEGYERARARDALSEGAAAFPPLRLQLFPKPAEPAPLPIESVLPASGEPDAAALAASADLFAEPDLQYWFLPETVLAPWLERYAAIRDSPIVLDRAAQIDRIEGILRDALRELFAGEAATSWRRRLGELAWALWQSDRRDAARRTWAATLALSRSEAGGTGIPFFEELVRRSFGLFLARESEREKEERSTSVLVTPDQLREERARTGTRHPIPPAPRRR